MDNSAIVCRLTQNVGRLVFPFCARLRHECNRTMLVFATVKLVAGLEPYDLRFCLTVFYSCNYPLSKTITITQLKQTNNYPLKAAGKCVLEAGSFVKCLGSKCSDYNDFSSLRLFHEIIHVDSIDPFATAPGRK